MRRTDVGSAMRHRVKACLKRRAAAVWVGLSLAVAAGGAASAASGDLDPGFGGASHGRVEFDLGGPSTQVQGVAVQPGGGIVSVGVAAGGVTPDAVAYRLHPDGTPDSGFGRVRLPGPTDASEDAEAAVAQPDGKVVVAGLVTESGGFTDIAVWRLTATGAIDTSFGTNGLVAFGRPGANDAALDVALDPQGRIVVAGRRVGVDTDLAVLRLTPEGAPDLTFNHGSPLFTLDHSGADVARSVAVQPDGGIVVGATYSGFAAITVLRIEPGTATTDADLDPGFGGGDGIADLPGTFGTDTPDVAVDSHGLVMVLGAVPTTGGSADGTVVRLTSVGTVDDSFGSATGAHIDVNDEIENLGALAVLPHGGVAVVGYSGDGTFVAKLRATGDPDTTMGTGGVRALPDALVSPTAAVAVLPDGRIVAVANASGSTGVAYRFLGDLAAPSCAGKKATIVGTSADDHLVGTRRVDVIAGLGGGDTITGLGKGDLVCGGGGADHIFGGAGNDQLRGQAGPDTLSGGKGDDRLVGGTGRDTLHGGPGHDTLRQ